MKIFDILGKTLALTVLVTLSAFHTSSEAAALVNLRGSTPEEAAITVNVSKPAGASNGLITLSSYDADVRDEGELVINGNAPVALFGTAGVNANNNRSADITIKTPATYWNNGKNTLRFRHTKTGGYTVENITVAFETPYPVDMTGQAPEETSVTVNVSKPADAINGLITLTTYDADSPDEGELVINGNTPVSLFGVAGVGGNNHNSANITISTPASHWKDGINTLLFRHTRTGGYIIDGVTVAFKTGLSGSPGGTGLAPLVLYTFNEGGGSTVRDVSGYGTPMDLAIQNTANTRWLADGGLSVDKPTFIRSSGSANKIINAIKASNALTIEAWLQPANTTQTGPARIATLSVDHINRNFTLAQNKSAYDVRLRTTSTDSNGRPSLASPAGTLGTALTHVVYTRDSAGTALLYVNGVKQSQKSVAGNMSNWTGSYGFALANEFTGDRPWTGKYYQVAVYDHAISAADVNANYSIGPDSEAGSGGNTADGGSNTAPAISEPPTQITPQTGSVNLSWTAPVARTDNTALSLSEIAGYTVYYGTSKGNYPDSLSINNGSATSATISNLPVGTYYLVVSTRDSDGRNSGYSSMVTKQVQ